MIARIGGLLESIEGNAALLRPDGPMEMAVEVLLPAYLARGLSTRVGERVVLHTLAYLEGQGQGTSFVPRLIGFASPAEREFFEVFTTVKGIGNRKALRALAEPVGVVAAAVVRGDARALVELPEIGKRLAETIIAELKGKVDVYATTEALAAGGGVRTASSYAGSMTAAQREAVDALVALGETRGDAERKVERVGSEAGTTDAIIAAVFGRR